MRQIQAQKTDNYCKQSASLANKVDGYDLMFEVRGLMFATFNSVRQ